MIFAFFFTVAAVTMVRVFGWNYIKAVLASGWSTTPGRVEFGSVEQRQRQSITHYVARIDYSYSVNNTYYSGYFERLFLRESSADKFLADMKNQVIFVRSNPNRPERSAFLKQRAAGRSRFQIRPPILPKSSRTLTAESSSALAVAFHAMPLSPMPQPLSRHHFADHPSGLGVPDFGDLIFGVPFTVVGVRWPRQSLCRMN